MAKSRRRFEALKGAVEPQAKVVKQSVCSWRFISEALKTCGLVLFYYCFSMTLTFYNKWFIHVYTFPLSITLTHLVIKFIMSGCVRVLLERCSGKERITLSWRQYFFRVAPPGVASSLDIGLSNWSFEYITVSLYTMTKTTVIIFILGFSILFRLERPRCSLIFVVLFIAIGLFMFTYESTQFHLLGFLLVLTASFLSGLRWTLSQIVMQKNELGLTHPLDMMYHIQPWMILTLLPLSSGFEGLHIASSIHTFRFQHANVLLEHLGILGAGALLAFMLELSEFLLLSRTSSLTLSISGIVKEIITLILAAVLNGDRMNAVNMVGLFVCLIGIIIHVILKAVHGEQDKLEPKPLDESVEMLLKNGTANTGDDNDEDDDEVDIFNVRRDR